MRAYPYEIRVSADRLEPEKEQSAISIQRSASKDGGGDQDDSAGEEMQQQVLEGLFDGRPDSAQRYGYGQGAGQVPRLPVSLRAIRMPIVAGDAVGTHEVRDRASQMGRSGDLRDSEIRCLRGGCPRLQGLLLEFVQLLPSSWSFRRYSFPRKRGVPMGPPQTSARRYRRRFKVH